MVTINQVLASTRGGLDQSAAGWSRSGKEATVDAGRLNGSQGVTTFLKVTGQVVHDPVAAAGFLQVVRMDPGHDFQRRYPHRCGPVIERGSGQTQQSALSAHGERWMIMIDQLATFMGVTAGEIF